MKPGNRFEHGIRRYLNVMVLIPTSCSLSCGLADEKVATFTNKGAPFLILSEGLFILPGFDRIDWSFR